MHALLFHALSAFSTGKKNAKSLAGHENSRDVPFQGLGRVRVGCSMFRILSGDRVVEKDQSGVKQIFVQDSLDKNWPSDNLTSRERREVALNEATVLGEMFLVTSRTYFTDLLLKRSRGMKLLAKLHVKL